MNSKGADPNRQSAYGIAPLHKVAAARGDALAVKIVDALVEVGAKVEMRNSSGRTPLSLAVESGHGRVAARLLELGAPPDVLDDQGRGPLFIAVEKKLYGTVKRLLEAGADPALGTRWDRPLQLAARTGELGITMLLLDYGAGIESTAPDGTTPFTAALLAEKYDVAIALPGRGADPLHAHDLGRTPVTLLVEDDNSGILRMVAAKGIRFAEARDTGVGLFAYAVRKRKWRALDEMLLYSDLARDRDALVFARDEAVRLAAKDGVAILERAMARATETY